MKPYRSLVAAALVAVIALPVSGYAADRDAVKGSARDADHSMTRAGTEVIESSALIGARVEARDGKKIGKIVQVLVDNSSGKVHDAVVATGGMAGVGTHKVVVPWSDLKIRNDKGKVVALADRAVLDRAPKFDERAMQRARDTGTAATPRTERVP